MKASTYLILLLSLIIAKVQLAQVNVITVSPGTAMNCDTITVNLSGNHTCPNDSITGITHSVVGSTITINVAVSTGFCIPQNPLPSWTATYTFVPSTVAAGSYTVGAAYNSSSSSASSSLTLTTCCPNQANAGNDTALCDVSSIQLSGNTLTSNATGQWSIISGSGSLTNGTQPNATLGNLMYGTSTLVWTTVDSSCTTSDTIQIANYQSASAAITEPDRISCTDTTTITANAISVGSGTWTSLQLGSIIQSGQNTPNALVKLFVPGSYDFAWTVTNGACVNSDTLTINYVALDSAPVITESNLVLTSSVAPNYQWYKDGNVIPGETNQTYTVSSNGSYKVLATLNGCSDGLFSNEIDITGVGIRESSLNEGPYIYPNPANSFVIVNGVMPGDRLHLYSTDMKLISSERAQGEVHQFDLSGLDKGLYLIRVETTKGTMIQKTVVKN